MVNTRCIELFKVCKSTEEKKYYCCKRLTIAVNGVLLPEYGKISGGIIKLCVCLIAHKICRKRNKKKNRTSDTGGVIFYILYKRKGIF